jgi:hypothetical protein
MKTIDLSDLKAGDKAWSCAYGEEKVTFVYEKEIEVGNARYYKNGKFFEQDTHPTLFHSEQECQEYLGLCTTLEAPESNVLTKREQFAMAAMQGLLANGMYSSHANEGVVDYAIEIADALLTKLNEKP